MNKFDGLHVWLGISPAEQPPNHYRLLGIPLFEADSDVIDNAAESRALKLKAVQTGPHKALSQQLLNQVTAAQICLLNPAKKAAYDTELARSQSVNAVANDQPVATVEASRPIVVAAANSHARSSAQAKRGRHTENSAWSMVTIVLGGIAGVFIAVMAVFYFTGQDLLRDREVAAAPAAAAKPPTQREIAKADPRPKTASGKTNAPSKPSAGSTETYRPTIPALPPGIQKPPPSAAETPSAPAEVSPLAIQPPATPEAATQPAPEFSDVAPNRWEWKVKFGNHEYALSRERLSWHEAAARCRQLGGHLATVETAEENAFLLALAHERQLPDFWIGATDEAQEGDWRWVTGDKVIDDVIKAPRDNWEGKEHWLGYWSPSRNWNDHPATQLPFLCEWEPASSDSSSGSPRSLADLAKPDSKPTLPVGSEMQAKFDAQLAKLQKDLTAYDAEMLAAKNLMLKNFAEAEAKVRVSKTLAGGAQVAMLSRLKVEREAFETASYLPFSEPMRGYWLAYLNKQKRAHDSLQNAFDRLIATNVKAKEDELASLLTSHRDQVLAPRIVARWSLNWTMYSNFTATSNWGVAPWEVKDDTFIIYWKPQRGPLTDKCKLNPLGDHFEGQNQYKARFSGDWLAP